MATALDCRASTASSASARCVASLVSTITRYPSAAIVTIWYGEAGTARLLIFSQVVLSLQLPFAIVPLVMFTADRRKMGALVAPRWVTALAVLTAIVVIALNVKLLIDFVFDAVG